MLQQCCSSVAVRVQIDVEHVELSSTQHDQHQGTYATRKRERKGGGESSGKKKSGKKKSGKKKSGRALLGLDAPGGEGAAAPTLKKALKKPKPKAAAATEAGSADEIDDIFG